MTRTHRIGDRGRVCEGGCVSRSPRWAGKGGLRGPLLISGQQEPFGSFRLMWWIHSPGGDLKVAGKERKAAPLGDRTRGSFLTALGPSRTLA